MWTRTDRDLRPRVPRLDLRYAPAIDDAPGPPRDPVLPEGFLERLQSILPPSDLDAAVASFAAAPPCSIRLNPLRADPASTAGALARAGFRLRTVTWCAEARVVEDGSARELQETDEHRRGAFHIQSLSSIAASLALAPEPDEHVLDLCAAPGSKASHLAALMENRGRLVANDLSRARSYRLREVLRGLGAEANVVVGPGEKYARRHPGAFDRVLVDAPCSGEGRFRAAAPESWSDWGLRKIRRLASLQKSLLHAAIEATRPGGVIVYATCTFAPEENELVLARALDRYGDRVALEPIPVPLPPAAARPPLTAWGRRALPEALEGARRLVPGTADGLDGFFLARLRRTC